jgi:hypothetical protein
MAIAGTTFLSPFAKNSCLNVIACAADFASDRLTKSSKTSAMTPPVRVRIKVRVSRPGPPMGNIGIRSNVLIFYGGSS